MGYEDFGWLGKSPKLGTVITEIPDIGFSPYPDREVIPIKDCWKTISKMAESGPPVLTSANNPPGYDVWTVEWNVTLQKECDCLPRGDTPPKFGKKTSITGDLWSVPPTFKVTTYDVVKECLDCDRYTEPPNSGGAGPWSIQYCEPEWHGRVGSFPTKITLPIGQPLNAMAINKGLAYILAGTKKTIDDWLADTGTGGARSMGYTESCCE